MSSPRLQNIKALADVLAIHHAGPYPVALAEALHDAGVRAHGELCGVLEPVRIGGTPQPCALPVGHRGRSWHASAPYYDADADAYRSGSTWSA